MSQCKLADKLIYLQKPSCALQTLESKKRIAHTFSETLDMIKEYTFSFYKKLLYNDIQAEIDSQFKNILRTFPG